MDDVASAHTENSNLRKIQQKLMQWEKKLAPLSTSQLNWFDRLQELDVSAPNCRSVSRKRGQT